MDSWPVSMFSFYGEEGESSTCVQKGWNRAPSLRRTIQPLLLCWEPPSICYHLPLLSDWVRQERIDLFYGDYQISGRYGYLNLGGTISMSSFFQPSVCAPVCVRLLMQSEPYCCMWAHKLHKASDSPLCTTALSDIRVWPAPMFILLWNP
jgi:hypothetical protein